MSAASLGGNIRTIWIAIRAMNYTQRVFDDMFKQMSDVVKVEGQMTQAQGQMADSATHMMIAGTMLLTLSAMLSSQMMTLAMSSQEGAGDIAKLTANFDAAKASLADAFYEILKDTGVLNTLNSILTFIADNKWAAILVGVLITVIAGVLALAGVSLLLTGVIQQVTNMYALLTGQLIIHNGVLTASTQGTIALSTAMTQLMTVAAPLMVAFTVFQLLQGWLGPIPALIFAIVAAVAALAVVMNLSGLGELLGLAGGVSEGTQALRMFGSAGAQMGTRAVQETGPIFAHKGEVVFNPATGRPSQIEGDIAGGGGQSIYENVGITIENVHTKADFEDVDDKMRTALRRNMRGRK